MPTPAAPFGGAGPGGAGALPATPAGLSMELELNNASPRGTEENPQIDRSWGFLDPFGEPGVKTLKS